MSESFFLFHINMIKYTCYFYLAKIMQGSNYAYRMFESIAYLYVCTSDAPNYPISIGAYLLTHPLQTFGERGWVSNQHLSVITPFVHIYRRLIVYMDSCSLYKSCNFLCCLLQTATITLHTFIYRGLTLLHQQLQFI